MQRYIHKNKTNHFLSFLCYVTFQAWHVLGFPVCFNSNPECDIDNVDDRMYYYPENNNPYFHHYETLECDVCFLLNS
jgi:hypothetical protein